MPLIDLTGQVFTRLEVIKLDTTRSTRKSYWLCKCNCPAQTIVSIRSDILKNETTRSCGCLRTEASKTGNSRRIHGAARSVQVEGGSQLDYIIWKNIKQRCYNVNSKSYTDYGLRGIKMYKEWIKSFISFATYIRTLPNCPSEEILISRLFGKRIPRTLDRINNNGNYEPGNLRWATGVEQQNNTRKNIIVSYKGETLTLPQAVRKFSSLPYKIVAQRLNRDGWELGKALTIPVNTVPKRRLIRFKRK